MLKNFSIFSRNQLGGQVMSLVSGALLFTLVVFSLSVFYFVNRTESAAWRGRQGEAARNAAGTVSGFIQRVQDALLVVSIVKPDKLAPDSGELKALLQENTAILEIIRMDAEGNVIASASRDKSVLANLITIPQSQWYLQARQGQTYIGDVQLSANDAPYLIMAIPGADKSVVAARVQMDILWTVVNNIHFGKSGEVVVITRAGDIIAHTNSEFVLARQTLYGRPEFSAILNASNNEWNGQYTDFHNKQVVAATAPVPGTNWIVITELSQSEAFAYSRTAVFVLGTEAFLLLLAVSLIVARFVRLLIAKPMEKLIIGADRVGQGDLQHRIEINIKNEIGQVASAFNSMAADLEKHQDNLHATIAYEYEVKRANELARSNAMNLALSKVATLLESSSNSELILDTLGAELKELGLDCGVVTVDPAGEAATIKYLSFNPAIIRTVEKLAGVSAKNYVIPKRYWPDDRALKERIPVWYSNPENMLRGMFPQIPETVAKMSLKLLGFKPGMQLCMLPLISREQVLGTLIIWGVRLYSSDDTILGVFASQVAGILQNAIAHENETRRANELARINTMILALSKVAAQLESSSDSVMIFETIGNELKKMGLDSMVGTLDDAKQNLQIRYISANPDVVRWAEKMTGYHLSDLTIPRRLWPSSKVVDERHYYWNSVKSTLNIFPIITENLQQTALKMAGINVNDPVCYLPIATEHEVIGMLCVWGSELKQSDLPALSILANQVATAIGNSNQYEAEARRARELDILLKASQATSSSLDFDTVMHTLASQLLEISGFECCFISEWDKDLNSVIGRLDHSRIFWREDLRESYSMADYPRSNQVLLTGNPIILQGDFEAEEKQWMKEMNRTAIIVLALFAAEKVIGLVELESLEKKKVFDPSVLENCQRILSSAASWVLEPLPANEPKKLFEVGEALLQATGASVCSFSEWDRPRNCVRTTAVFSNTSWEEGQGPGFNPNKEVWKDALYQGTTSFFENSQGAIKLSSVVDNTQPIAAESLIVLPLQKGDERIGVIELYDFNHKVRVTPGQITLLRTIADKASYSIENARLLQLTQKKLDEQIILLHEKEVLLKEIHHRVKNNLQIISSLLNLQTDHVKDTGMLRALRDSQARVRSMALIHEKLYQSKSLAKIDFGEYVQSLARDLFRSYQRTLGDIKLNIQVDEVILDLDYAVPCGLILNELMTNALKYAFPNGKDGTITVELRADPDHTLSLRVADDGVGLPSGLDILNNKSLGLQLVNSLVMQVEGKLEVKSSMGTAFLVSFKV